MTFIRQTTNHRAKRIRRGFTLIEALAVLFIFSVVSISFYQTWTLSVRHMLDARNRLGATALANQKMEMVRSLDYDSIGTKAPNGSGGWVYGIPAGDILQNETVAASNATFSVHTFVQYVDDLYDGRLGGSPSDSIPTDYKRIRVTVSWGDATESRQIALFATVSPEGVESASNTGVLSINVLDATGTGVSGATVRVVNAALSVDFSANTDATGNLMIPGAAAGDRNYSLTVSKSDFFGVRTYPAAPASSFDPIDVHASVVVSTINQKSMIMDRSADITLRTEDPFGTALADVDFQLKGGRQTGVVTGSNPAEPVYAFSVDEDTGGDGENEYGNESYGQYFFTLDIGETGYALLRINPVPVAANKTQFEVLPGESKTARVVLMDKSIDSLFVTVTNSANGAAIPGATVRLRNATLGYDTTVSADVFGQVFFPTALPVLQPGTYDIETTASGYANEAGTVAVSSGGGLVLESVVLTAN